MIHADKIYYQGPTQDQYVDGNFFGLMLYLGADMIVHRDIPHPQNPRLKGYIVNVWDIDGVRVTYHSSCGLDESNSGIAAVILEGQPQKISEVEKKIEEGVKRGLHLEGIPGIFDVELKRNFPPSSGLLRIQSKSF